MKFALKPLGEKRKENRKFLTWDIETVKWTRFLVAGMFDGNEFFYYKRLSSLLRVLLHKYSGYVCFSHFGGKFDHLFMLKAILRHNAECSPMDRYILSPLIPRGSSVFSFDVSLGENSITFSDSSALFPFSLDRLTRSFGVQHKKQKIDYSRIRKVTPRLLEYLEHDCRGLYESIEKFEKWPLIEKAGRAQTIASQSVKVLRTFLKDDIGFVGGKPDQEMRQAYMGGRTEIFKPFYEGKKPLYCYDVNSLYPFVMKKHKFPNYYLGETHDYVPNQFAIYEAIATIPKMHVPPIGIVRRGKYVFPVGSFRCYVTSAEIEYARSLGCEFKVVRGWLFSDGGRIFKKFVDSLYEIRTKSPRGSVDNTIAKLLLNSCYGKFGQRSDREQIVFDDGSDGLLPLAENAEITVGNKTYRLMLKEIELDCFSNVAIAAFVTAYARIHMHKLLRKCGDELYYTDTDSLFTTKKLKTGEGLGELKEEYECFSACFLLPKTYIAGKKIVMKGFEKKKLDQFSFEDFTATLRGEFERLKCTQEPKFASLKTAMRQGDLTILTKKSTRQIRSEYDKRKIWKTSDDLNQWTTKPIKLKRKKQ